MVKASWEPHVELGTTMLSNRKSGILGGKNAVSSGGRKLLRIKSKRFELSSILPEHRAVVQLQPRQATFDRSSDEIRCEERERNRHIDLTHTAFLAYRDLLDANHRARHDLVKPATRLRRSHGALPAVGASRGRLNLLKGSTEKEWCMSFG